MLSSSDVILYKCLSMIAVFGLILSLIGNFLRYLQWDIVLSAIFKIILVIILVVIEFAQTPAIVKGFSFMFYFLGRGVFYVILGFLTMSATVVSLVGGILMIVVGLIFIVLHFAHHNREPEYMSFKRYQRLTSGITHDLPTTAVEGQNVYPAAHQTPLSQPNVPHHSDTFSSGAAGGQYNNTHTITTHISSVPASPMPIHTDSEEKTEV